MSILRYFRRKPAATDGPNPPAGGPDTPTAADLERLVSTSYRHALGALPDTKNQWSRLETAIQNRPEGARTRLPARIRFATPRFAYAAVAAIALTLLIINHPLNRAPQLEHFATSRGEQSSIVLPDGSEVLLNHTSSLDFNASAFAGAREVTLSGEAYFSVRRLDAPFTVTTDAGSVTVTGTKFNVRVRRDRYEVGVTEGSVETVVPMPGRDTTIRITAGEALAGVRNEAPMPVRKIAHPAYPGWTERTLIFTNMPVASVCDEIENSFDVRITIEDSDIGALTVSGAFIAHDVRSVIASICALTGRNYRYENATYTLY